MASRKEYVDFVVEQVGENGRARSMMGEYLIYYRDKVLGGVCDDRFLIKPTKSALEAFPNAPLEPPYNGAKEMLVVEDLDDRDTLRELFKRMYPELPAPKPKKKKNM